MNQAVWGDQVWVWFPTSHIVFKFSISSKISPIHPSLSWLLENKTSQITCEPHFAWEIQPPSTKTQHKGADVNFFYLNFLPQPTLFIPLLQVLMVTNKPLKWGVGRRQEMQTKGCRGNLQCNRQLPHNQTELSTTWPQSACPKVSMFSFTRLHGKAQ